MAELERLLQRLKADMSQFHSALQAARGELTRTDQATTRTTRTMRDRFAETARSLLNIPNVLRGLAGALAVREIVDYANS